MTGKQRRRLNWLKATKRQRKAAWLTDQMILRLWDWLGTPDTFDPSATTTRETTDKGIIPWIIEQQERAKQGEET